MKQSFLRLLAPSSVHPDVKVSERIGQSRNCTAEKRSESDKEGFSESRFICYFGETHRLSRGLRGGIARTRLMTFPYPVSDRERERVCVRDGHVDGVHLSTPRYSRPSWNFLLKQLSHNGEEMYSSPIV